MECSSCGHENRAGARFCEECGQPAAITCINCGAELRSTARFCDQCGTRLERSPGPVGSPSHGGVGIDEPTPTPLGGGAVRKTVTVLFCDVVGSTAFAERVDAETARDIMGRYHAMARAAIEATGGSVAKFIGDGVMAIWGTPEISPDDAVHAVAAGVALQDGFAPIGAATEDRLGIELGLRVGINTGEVVIAADDADIVGDALNTAARLEAACAPGGVVVGESTWRLTRSTVEYEPLEPVAVKGKIEPVATFRVAGRTRDALDRNSDRADGNDSTPPFVGRDRELALLRADFDAAVAERSVRLATVIGTPGVGKTRLAAELVASLQQSSGEVMFFDLRCEEANRAPFGPIRDLLLAALVDGGHISELAKGGLDSQGSESLLAAIDGILDPSLPDRDRLVDLLGSFVGASDSRSTEESFFAVRRLLEELGGRRPVVAVFDDIQWAEPLLLDLLEHLAEWGSGGAVLIVGLGRPELRTIRPTLSEPGRRVGTVVNLEGLAPADTERLAAELLAVDHVAADLVARLPASTEGNPLFVRELVRMLVDDGVIVRAGGTFELTVDAEAVQVPPTIQSLLATRVERLPADERRILELAAVVGPEFPRGAVAALAPDTATAELDSILERLRRRELIDPVGSYWGDEPILRFHHVLVREAAYRRLLKATRAELHLMVARWTAETAGSVVGHHESAIAVHYEKAYHYRAELGPVGAETAAIGIEAAELLTAAATRALAMDDLATAGSSSRRALATIDPADRRCPALLLIACEALTSSGAIDIAGDQVAALRAAADNDRLEGWATCFESQLQLLTDPTAPEAVVIATEGAARQLAKLGDDAGVAKARQIRASAFARLGRIGACEAELDQALAAARAAEDGRRISAVLGAAPVAALWGPSTVPRAGGRCLDVVRLLRITDGSPAVEAVSLRCQGVLEALRGRFDQARELLGQARSTAEELGLRQSRYETELYAGIVELLADEPSAAEPHLREARAGLGRLGIGADAGQASAHLARSLLRQGRVGEAEAMAAEAADRAGQNLQTVIAAGAVRAEIEAASGEVESARRSAQAAVATAAKTDVVVDHALALTSLARVLEAAGDAGATDAWADVALLAAAKEAPALAPSPMEDAALPVDRGQEQRPAGDRDAEVQQRAYGGAPEDQLLRAGLAQPMRVAIDNVVESVATRDIDGLADLLSPDLTVDDRRSEAPRERDRVAHLAAVRALFENGADADLTLALRELDAPTDRTLLAAVAVTRSPGSGTETLVVGRLALDGRFDRLAIFDPEQRDEARAEVARLALPEAMGEPMAGAWSDISEAYRLRDIERFARWLHPDFVLDDRRTGVTLERDRGAHVAAVQALFDESGRLIATIDDVRLRGPHLMLGRATILRGTDARTEFLMVASMVARDPSNRFDRYVVFDLDDEGAAMAELDQLADRRTSVTENTAARLMRTLVSEAHPDDLSIYDEVVSPSIVREDRRRGVADDVMEGRDAMVAMTARVFATGFRYLDPVVVEQRGDRLALVRSGMATPAGDRVGIVGVCRSDAEDQLDRLVFFDEQDLAAARVELDWLAATAGTRATATTAEMFRRMGAGDADAATELFADDLRQEDLRVGFSLGVVDRQQLGALAREVVTSDLGAVKFDVVAIATAGDDVVLNRVVITRPDEYVTELLHVAQLNEQGLVSNIALLDPEDETKARVEVLERAGRGPNRAALAMEESLRLTNELSEAMGGARSSRSSEGLSSVEIDRQFEALVAPDMVREDRRSGLGFGAIDRDGFLLAIKAFLDLGGRQENVRHVAWRGRDLVLSRYDHYYGPDNRSEMLIINRFNSSDQLVRTVVYDPAQEAEALAELERLHTFGSPAARHRLDNTACRLITRAFELLNEGQSLDELSTSAGWVREDRRYLPFPEMNADEYRDAVEEGVFHRGRPQWAAWPLAIRGDHLVLMRQEETSANGFEKPTLAVFETDEQGEALRTVIFDGDDLEGAEDYLDERWHLALDPTDADDARTIRAGVAASDRKLIREWIELDAGVAVLASEEWLIVAHVRDGQLEAKRTLSADRLDEARRAAASLRRR